MIAMEYFITIVECIITNCKAVIRNVIFKFITRLNKSTIDALLANMSSRYNLVQTLYVQYDLVYCVAVMHNSR